MTESEIMEAFLGQFYLNRIPAKLILVSNEINSQTLMETSVVSAKTFEISAASPNPFNPATQIQLNLNTDAMVSVKVFNTMGQLVDIIASGQMQHGTYSFTWDGSNAASGVYLVQTQVGAEVHNQKIMLVK